MINNIITTAQAVHQYIGSIPVTSWYHLLSFLGTVLSSMGVLALLRKHYYTVHNERMAKHITALLLGVIAFLFNTAQAIALYGTFNPTFLGQRTADVLGVAFLVYHLGGNTTFIKVRNKLQVWSDNGKAYNAEISAPQPVATTTEPTTDASSIL